MINTHPTGGEGVFGIELRPNTFNQSTFDEVINRQGQFVDWQKSKPCPVRTETSHHNLHCTVCYGRGEIYEYQENVWIFGESPPHGYKNPRTCEEGLIKPWINPINEVGNIILFRSEHEGGYVKYDVDYFNDTDIKILPDDEEGFPPSSIGLLLDYAVRNFVEKSQTFTGDGQNQIFDLDLDLPLEDVGTNNFDVKMSISQIKSVKKVSDSQDLPVRTFFNQSVYLETPPDNGVDFEIIVNSVNPIIMVIQPLKIKYAKDLGWDMENGDLMAVASAGFDFGKGDIITCYGMNNRVSEVIARTTLDYDMLPYFNISEILGNIIDENGIIYLNQTDFKLFDYNKIKWVGTKPPSGISYSLTMYERATYRMHNENPEINSNENKRLPKNIHLRKIGRYSPAPIYSGLKNDDRPVGDWTKEFGGI